jgi:hypothetical protein
MQVFIALCPTAGCQISKKYQEMVFNTHLCKALQQAHACCRLVLLFSKGGREGGCHWTWPPLTRDSYRFQYHPTHYNSTLHNTNTIDGVIHLIGLLWFGVCVVIWYCCVIFPVFWCKYYLVQHVTIQKMIKKYFIKNVLIKNNFFIIKIIQIVYY